MKTVKINVELDRESMNRLEVLAKQAGISREQMLVQILVTKVKRDHDQELIKEARKEIDKASGVTLVLDDGEVMTIEEELARR